MSVEVKTKDPTRTQHGRIECGSSGIYIILDICAKADKINSTRSSWHISFTRMGQMVGHPRKTSCLRPKALNKYKSGVTIIQQLQRNTMCFCRRMQRGFLYKPECLMLQIKHYRTELYWPLRAGCAVKHMKATFYFRCDNVLVMCWKSLNLQKKKRKGLFWEIESTQDVI